LAKAGLFDLHSDRHPRLPVKKPLAIFSAGIIVLHTEYPMADRTGPTNGQEKQLPLPDVEVARSGTPAAAMTAAEIKGMLLNPLYAGVGVVSDAQWVAACKRLLQQDGPEQFLVNLLFVLRQSLET
jgi:hypothetical protein